MPGALPATEVVYLTTYIDSEGQQLDASGGNTYSVDFELPLPAGAFWSLAMYNESNSFFIANPINRWVINNQASFRLWAIAVYQCSPVALHDGVCEGRPGAFDC